MDILTSIYKSKWMKNVKKCLAVVSNYKWIFHRCLSRDIMQEPQYLTSPCHRITLRSWEVVAKSWYIKVHKSFIVNITIYEAFVPYTDWCSPHHITVLENTKQADNVTIDQFCGLIRMEPVYTKGREGVIYLYSDAQILPTEIHIIAGYQVCKQELVYRYNENTTGLITQWAVNRRPSLSYLFHGNMVYFWYTTASIYVPVQGDNNTSSFVISQPSVLLNSFICSGDRSDISMYPGLLPMYWVLGKVNPIDSIKCNLTRSRNITVQHLHSTVVLSVPLITNVTLFMTFNSTDVIFNKQLYQYKTNVGEFLQVEILPSALGSLTFDSFYVNITTSTVRPHLVSSTTTHSPSNAHNMVQTPKGKLFFLI